VIRASHPRNFFGLEKNFGVGIEPTRTSYDLTGGAPFAFPYSSNDLVLYSSKSINVTFFSNSLIIRINLLNAIVKLCEKLV
jgi:hypothetical protein